jgi:hypothetical protein
MLRRLVLACAVPCLLALPASADLVTLRNGSVMEGETESTPAGLWVKRPSGSVRLDHGDVLRVESRATPWQELEARLQAVAPGDAEGVLDVAFFALDLGLDEHVERVVAKALTDPLPPADLGTTRLGLLCVERGLHAQARRLLLHAILANPQSASAAIGLQRLDFHLVNGQWQAPEDYYPAQGFVRFEGRWALPEEVTVSESRRLVVLARAEAAEAHEELERAERALERAEDAIPAAQARAARAEARAVGAREALRARAQDLEIAERQSLAARYERQAYAPSPCDDPRQIQRHRRALEQAVTSTQAAADEARQARDAALRELERALCDQAEAPRWLADARQDLLEAEAELERTNRAATQAALALQAAEQAAQDARRALVAARRS